MIVNCQIWMNLLTFRAKALSSRSDEELSLETSENPLIFGSSLTFYFRLCISPCLRSITTFCMHIVLMQSALDSWTVHLQSHFPQMFLGGPWMGSVAGQVLSSLVIVRAFLKSSVVCHPCSWLQQCPSVAISLQCFELLILEYMNG